MEVVRCGKLWEGLTWLRSLAEQEPAFIVADVVKLVLVCISVLVATDEAILKRFGEQDPVLEGHILAVILVAVTVAVPKDFEEHEPVLTGVLLTAGPDSFGKRWETLGENCKLHSVFSSAPKGN